MAEATLSDALDKIRKQQNSNVPAIKRPATLLHAIDATLATTASGEGPPPQAYLIALLSTLTQLTASPAASLPGEKRELLEATLYLLAIIAPHLDGPALRSKASTLAVLTPLFASFDASAPVVKSLVTFSQYLIAALPSLALEKDVNPRNVYSSVLSLAADSRPKVRRKAQDVIVALLTSPPPPNVTHPYAEETAEWVLAKLDESVRGAKRSGKKEEGAKGGKKEEGGSDESRAIALLVFIKNLGSAWPESATATLLPLLLSTLTLSSPHLTLSALTVLSHLFSSSRQSDIASLSPHSVSTTLAALVAAKPHGGEGEHQERLLGGWVEGVGEGLVALARTEKKDAFKQTLELFPTILNLFPTAGTPAFRQAIESSLEMMIRHCITDEAIVKGSAKPIVELVEKALTSSRFAAGPLPHILGLAKALFLRFRTRPTSTSSLSAPSATKHLSKTLFLAGRMREDNRFEWKKEAEGVILAATTVCGPEWVLSVLPLGLESSNPNPGKARAWLLPLLKQSVTNTRLGHFKSYLVPLSAELWQKKEASEGMQAKIWDTLVGQVWALLPGYCEFATDLVEAFDASFVELLGTILYDSRQASLRPAIFKALQNVLHSATTLAKSTGPDSLLREQFGVGQSEGQQAIVTLRGMAPAILGVCFNTYGLVPRGEGAYVLACVSDWVGVLGPEEVHATYTRMETLLNDALGQPVKKTSKDEAVPATHSLLDILIAMVPSAGPVHEKLFEFALQDKVLANEDQAVQKKAYRILARLVEETKGGVVKGRVGEVLEKLSEGKDEVAGGAKRDRTHLLSELIPLLPADSLHHIPSIIPEAVLATKESNEKTRETAYDLVVAMGRKMAEGGTIARHKVKGMEEGMEEEAPATVAEYLTMVSAGLAGSSPHMISASITSLSRLIFEFHEQVTNELLGELLSTLIVFLTSANREIVRAAIGFIKVAIVTLPASLIEPNLPALVPALINWSHEHSNHFKVKIRHILERLIRRHGVELVEKEVPEEDKKLIQNIKKRQARSKKKKAREDDDGDAMMDGPEAAPKPQAASRSAYDEVLYGSDSDVSASDDEREQAPASARNRKSQQRKNKEREQGAFLHEDDEQPLDLLDDRMMSRISAARKPEAPRKPLDSHFKEDKSGRLRITEEDSDDEALPGSRDMGAYLEAMEGADGHTKDSRGRVNFNKTQGKRARGDEDDDDEADFSVTEGLKELEVAAGGKKRKTGKKESVRVGGEFKAKRAGGDVERNGMKPYAYVPLQSVAGKKKNQRTNVSITGHKRSGKKNK